MISNPDPLLTTRLALTPAGTDRLDDIYALHSDERVWRHFPQGRHTDIEHTRRRVRTMEQHWAHDGLGYWVADTRETVGGLVAGEFVGVGGCAVESDPRWWNLYYRFRPEAQGHRLAGELALAALAAARDVDPGRPVVARLLETNPASRATAERAGLTLQWRGPEQGTPGAIRLVYADRRLHPGLLSAIAPAAG